jgi:isopentenyldiphosphate isomerase
MAFVDRIRECNTHDPAKFRAFHVAGWRVGAVRLDRVARLASFRDVFTVDDDAVTLRPDLATPEQRSAAIARVVASLEAAGEVRGRRDEFYPVAMQFGTEPLLQIERAAVPFFGVRAYGVHMTGFVRGAAGMSIWVPRRARGRHNFPGMLDNTVAGGQPVGIGLRANLVKECGEEAGIPPELAVQARGVGAISYCVEHSDGLKPDMQFCFDLELPAEFTPRNTDGEVESFMLWPVERVMAIVRDTQEFKFNCNLVLIDFFLRHGLIDCDDPDYVALVEGLHR